MQSDHLNEMEMSYPKHMQRALRFSFYCFLSAVKSLVHAFIPDMFIDTSEKMDHYLEEFIFDTED